MVTVTKRSFEPLERIEFDFVLLPDDAVLTKLKCVSETISLLLSNLTRRDVIPSFWRSYINQSVVIPHLSMGQCGVLGCELEPIKEIVCEVSQLVPQFVEPMNTHLSVLDNHVFFDVAHCFKTVNPLFVRVYLLLRDPYFEKIRTKFPIAQALLIKKNNSEESDEATFINRYYQN